MKKSGNWFKSAIVLTSLTFVLAACGGNNNAPAAGNEGAASNAPRSFHGAGDGRSDVGWRS